MNKILNHYNPKEITQQIFLKKYPNYDGRGVLIAILDGGIDVSLPGLQKTTTGLPKIVDCFDFTDSGKVDTSTIRHSDPKGNLIALTGRKLKIPDSWKNPLNKWHLGIKYIYELYSKPIVDDIIKLRKESISQKNKDLQSNLNPKVDDKENSEFMKAYLESVEDLSKESLVVDCIVWHDGICWRATIDTSFCCDLADVKVLTNYRDEHEFGFITVEKQMKISFCLNINKNGNSLEIITSRKSHGSMVAQAAAAHFPHEQDKDGLAPGAQILQKCVEMGVDIINCSFSFGKYCTYESVFKVFKEVSEKHGIVIVKYWGNDGPCLSTLKYDKEANLGLVFNIGAAVSSDMKKHLYNISDDKSSPTYYHWSSHGPLLNGGLGVDLAAPGAMIADLPECFTMKKEITKGTSISSPNAAGNIACILSGLNACSLLTSPFNLKLALMNTALINNDRNNNKLAMGNGILQTLTAFEFLKTHMDIIPNSLINIEISVKYEEIIFRGIYLSGCNEIMRFMVNISPVFNPPSADYFATTTFLLKMSTGAEKFVKCPNSLRFPEEKSFQVEIDPLKLKAGKCYFAEIFGINLSNLAMGALFRVPITVVSPKKVTQESKYTVVRDIMLKPEVPYRLLLHPPHGSYQCVLKMHYLGEKIVEIIGASNIKSSKKKFMKTFYFSSKNKHQTACFYVKQKNILEICLVKKCGFQGTSKFKIKVEFYGFQTLSPKSIPFCNFSIWSCKTERRCQVLNHLRETNISFSMEFTKCQFYLNPIKAELKVNVEETKTHNQGLTCLNLQYELNMPEAFECHFKACIKKHKYPIEFCFFKVLTLSNKLVSEFSTTEGPLMLEKGNYAIIGKIWSQQLGILKKYKKLFIRVELSLKNPILRKCVSTDKSMPNKNSKILMKKGQKLTLDYDEFIKEEIPYWLHSEAYFSGSLCHHFGKIIYKHPISIPVNKSKYDINSLLQKGINKVSNLTYGWLKSKFGSTFSNEIFSCLVQINHFHENNDLEKLQCR